MAGHGLDASPVGRASAVRAYKRRGVDLVVHSFHAGHASAAELRAALEAVDQPADADGRSTIPGVTMPATAVAAASSSHLWISCSNTSARQSCFASFVVRPDGLTAGRLHMNRPGVLVTAVDPERELYDSTAAWRERAMRGILHSGTLVRDERSRARTRL
ncbi:MAG TPA: hypothetical protein VE777_02990 [Gaiellales bacterium]|nr:hypothetical protein [Gaiellales bacterium]